jgi:hypothetical protein
MGAWDAIQNVLTKGLDVAGQVVQTKLQVNDPTFNTVGPNGRGGKAGEGSYGASLDAVPTYVWVGGAAVVLLLGFMLLRK